MLTPASQSPKVRLSNTGAFSILFGFDIKDSIEGFSFLEIRKTFLRIDFSFDDPFSRLSTCYRLVMISNKGQSQLEVVPHADFYVATKSLT